MGFGAITQYVDVAQLVLYAFWAFFFGLIYYLVRENHREGYPMDTDRGVHMRISGWPVPQPKTYLLHDGSEISVPRAHDPQPPLNAEPMHPWNAAAREPVGDPMLAMVGPGAYALRADVPDVMPDGVTPKIVPLRTEPEYGVASQDRDVRGFPVIGADGETAGTVRDLWLDKCELMFRYLEVELAGGRTVLLPMPFARVRKDEIKVDAILSTQFSNVPALKTADRITLLEEEMVSAYFGGGTLYATPERAEPLL